MPNMVSPYYNGENALVITLVQNEAFASVDKCVRLFRYSYAATYEENSSYVFMADDDAV